MKVYNAIAAEEAGEIAELLPNGTTVEEDDPLAKLK
jgi:biotin carboxyl carrier protein